MRKYEPTVRKFRRRQLSRRIARYCGAFCCLLFSAFFAFFWTIGIGDKVNLVVLRTVFQLRGPIQTSNEIVILAIDKDTLDSLGIPLPRMAIAKAMEILLESGAKGLLIDASIPEDARESKAHELMRNIMARLPTVIGSGSLKASQSTTTMVDIGTELSVAAVARRQFPFIFYNVGGAVKYPYAVTDALKSAEKPYELANLFREVFELGSKQPRYHDLINYYGPPGTIPRISLISLLRSPLSTYLNQIKDKLVFMGIQSEEAPDRRDEELFFGTYSAAPIYGVEIIATLAENLVQKNWIRALDPLYESAVIIGGLFIVSIFQCCLTPRIAFVGIGAVLTVISLLTYATFSTYDYWIPVLAPLVTYTLITIPIVAIYRLLLSERLHRYIDCRVGL